MVLEICTNSLHSAINAQKGGAHRIELCCNLEQGGLTPSSATIRLARKYLNIEIFVLIRPRIGDFSYSDLEFEQIKEDILFCKKEGVDGVVFGLLNEHNEIDVDRNRKLLRLAHPMKATFHRAFDCLKSPLKKLEQIIDLGFDRILTSGLQPTAIGGSALIKKLIQQANNRIIIIPGGGLNSKNIYDFVINTKATEIHTSAKKIIPTTNNILFSKPYFETDVEEVGEIISILEQKIL